MNIPPFLETIPAQLLACLASGLFLAISFGLVVLLGKAWRHAWAWIDDSRPGRNPVLELMARLRGWTPWDTQGSSSIYLWWKDKKGETKTDAFSWLFFIAFWVPLSIYLVVKLYALALFVASLVAIAFVARFARRHKKLFDKHIKDPEAHK
ncbi:MULTISPECIES: hypothetical protein [Pseudomonas]|uniref:hypothetical protein n=1 Tax=Pseudomonas TaxID=286 RepID=UPI00083E5F28|nr:MULTISPECIES: hypothetical protein [Pseudomonas]MBF8732838.1 hypothetical protein [Pseudomonas guariconensis]ODB39573.1 hypothetical protein A9L43_15845 [Pseudomonas mosselii]